jgi:hypothetical protein
MAIDVYSDTAGFYEFTNMWVNTDANGFTDWVQVEWDSGWNTYTDYDQYNQVDWYAYTYASNPYTGVAYNELIYDTGAIVYF